MAADYLTCVHTKHGAGLCSACRRDYEEDPCAWIEFGRHTAGEERWAAEQAAIAAEKEAMPPVEHDDSELPF